MRAALEARLAELSREIRDYPTPIARCDVQLGALLEERSRVVRELQRLEEPACAPETVWVNDGGRA